MHHFKAVGVRVTLGLKRTIRDVGELSDEMGANRAECSLHPVLLPPTEPPLSVVQGAGVRTSIGPCVANP